MADQIDEIIKKSLKEYVKENTAQLTSLFNQASKYLAKCIDKNLYKIHNYNSVQFFDDFGNLSSSDFLSKTSMSLNGLNMELTYNNELTNVLRPSIFYSKTKKKANVFWLINDGYSVKKNVWFKHINNFGQRAAQHFVEKGIQEFNSSNPYGLYVDVNKGITRPLLYFGR